MVNVSLHHLFGRTGSVVLRFSVSIARPLVAVGLFPSSRVCHLFKNRESERHGFSLGTVGCMVPTLLANYPRRDSMSQCCILYWKVLDCCEASNVPTWCFWYGSTLNRYGMEWVQLQINGESHSKSHERPFCLRFTFYKLSNRQGALKFITSVSISRVKVGVPLLPGVPSTSQVMKFSALVTYGDRV